MRKSSVSLIVKSGGLFLALAVSLILGRTIGAEGLGIINLSNRIVNILLLFGLFGIQDVVVKNVAISRHKSDFQHIGNTLYTSTIFNGILTIILSASIILISKYLSTKVFHDDQLYFPLIITLSVMFFQLQSRIYSAALIGYRKIWQSNLFDQVLSSMVIATTLILLNLVGYKIGVIEVAAIYAVSRIIVTFTVFTYWHRVFRFKPKRELIIKELIQKSTPLFIVTISTTIINNIDIIILGIISSSKDVGLYSVAAQIALIPRTLLIVVNSALSPQIATLFNARSMRSLERLTQTTIMILMILSVLILTLFTIFGRSILILWGTEFIGAYKILLILSFGHLYNLATGPTGILLIMCDLEKVYRNSQILIVIFTLIISIVFAFLWGIVGVAIAQAITIIVNNTIQIIILKQKLNFRLIPSVNLPFK